LIGSISGDWVVVLKTGWGKPLICEPLPLFLFYIKFVNRMFTQLTTVFLTSVQLVNIRFFLFLISCGSDVRLAVPVIPLTTGLCQIFS